MSSLHTLTQHCQSFLKQHPHIDVDFDTLQHFYTDLIDCLTDHNHLYYIKAQPIITDQEYDQLFAYLKKIESDHPELINENSPTQQLINQIAEGFDKAEHTKPLLSLDNSYNAEDLIDFDTFVHKRVPTIQYIIQPKFDGISVEIIYKNGIFHQAITRGDGKVGEDITQNVKTIHNLPYKLEKLAKTNTSQDKQESSPSFLSLRGEIMMPKSQWKKLNAQREEEGKIPFANTRNAAAGSVKLLDANIVAQRGLVCYVYDIIQSNQSFESAQKQYNYLQNLGLPVRDWQEIHQDIQQVIQTCEKEKTQKYFLEQDIDFDGLVIKVNEVEHRKTLGSTEHHPRWAIAYKFPAQQVATKIVSVDYQIGRTGIVTPVGNLEAVQLSGVTIQRVSLHNFDFVKEKDIHQGDRIWLQRSGEVIPHVVSVIKERRDGVQTIQAPQNCPVCEQAIHQIQDHYYCTNSYCPAVLKGKLRHFVSKQCMNIDGIGESIIQILLEQNIIQQTSDIYTILDPMVQAQIKRLPGFGDKKVHHIIQELEKSKTIPVWRFLNALGLNGIGKKIAQTIQKSLIQQIGEQQQNISFHDLQQLLINEEFMLAIDGIGTIIVQSLQNYFSQELNQQERNAFQSHGISLEFPHTKKDGSLSGQHFSLTGSFPISRDELIGLFEQQGAIFQSSPTKKSNFMLIGEKPGSKKAKAEKLNIPLIIGRDKAISTYTFLQDTQLNNPKSKPQAQSLF